MPYTLRIPAALLATLFLATVLFPATATEFDATSLSMATDTM